MYFKAAWRVKVSILDSWIPASMAFHTLTWLFGTQLAGAKQSLCTRFLRFLILQHRPQYTTYIHVAHWKYDQGWSSGRFFAGLWCAREEASGCLMFWLDGWAVLVCDPQSVFGASLLVGCYLKELLEDVMIWPAEDSSEELLVRCEEEQSAVWFFLNR